MSQASQPAPRVRREFFGPRDNFPLSAADFATAGSLCDTMVELRAGRAEYLARRGLDPKVYLPAHMWSGDFCASNFAKIARKDPHTISHLRCLTYNFTGYSLLTMAPCENTPELLAVPPDADAIVRSVAGRAADAAVEFVRSIQGVPRDRVVTAPRVFGESGWDVDGTIVNFDTWSLQQRINALHGSGVLDFVKARAARRGHARVLEIGAGYGNLAYNLHEMLGPTEYFVVDLPESMIFSSIYLAVTRRGERCTVLRPDAGFAAGEAGTTFVANHLLDEFLPRIGEIDLVVNTLSLSEMSAQQVAFYGDRVRQCIGDRGVFFEQNYIVPGVHTDIVAVLAPQFAHGAVLDETAPPHRGRGTARLWAERYCGELFDRGGVAPIRARADAAAGPGAAGPPRAPALA